MSRPDAFRGRIRPKAASVAAAIARLAERQHGVVARRQLIALGVPPRTITGWVECGRLHRIHRGVYAVGHRRIGLDGHRMAAVLLAGGGSFLSHWSAADLTGIVRMDERSVLHVGRLTRSGADPVGIVIHRMPRIEPIDLTVRRGIPTTTATRALFDLTPSLTAVALRRAFERAENLRVIDEARLRAFSAEARGHRGVANLRALLGQADLPLAETRSMLESRLLRICREHGIPIPAVNVPLLGFEVDFLWERERLVVEVDGPQHLGRQRDRDNERDLALARAGYLVRRYSEDALGDARRVAHEVLAVLSERRSA